MTNIWQGNFSSRAYTSLLVFGEIITELPKNLDKLEGEYNFEIEYRGMFRHGAQMNLKAKFEKDKFVCYIGATQRITFTIEELTDDIIAGTYRSENPSDSGTFLLNKV
ncbi:MAG: hypothetical protein Solivirus2_11 [Solivirus sp.]|uniref:Uncharacterized protein n=1 Tax=Solivirus sp. TaxID=2487772 RepID=A0A3G5AFH4_9VIRU|nr:MAG: hypothetical protein Solivirus2_11 [Solivirus sp.]